MKPSDPKYIVSDDQKHLIHEPTGLMIGIESTSHEHLRVAMKRLRPMAERLEAGQDLKVDDDDDWGIFKQLKRGRQVQRESRREDFAISAAERGWTKHHDTHFSRMVNGKKLDYWPGPKKWRYNNRTMFGDVQQWLRKHDPECIPLQQYSCDDELGFPWHES